MNNQHIMLDKTMPVRTWNGHHAVPRTAACQKNLPRAVLTLVASACAFSLAK